MLNVFAQEKSALSMGQHKPPCHSSEIHLHSCKLILSLNRAFIWKLWHAVSQQKYGTHKTE